MQKNSWLRLFPSDLADHGAGWTLPALPSDEVDGALWASLAKAVDPRFERPQHRSDVVIEPLSAEQGAILTDETRGVYVQVAPEDLYLWERMDGTRSQIDLVVDYVMKYKALAPTRIAGLVEALRENGLLTEPPDELYPRLYMHFKQSTGMGRVNKFTGTFLKREFAISGVDRVIGAVYRTVGWIFYTLPAQIVLWLVAVLGLGAFLWLLSRREFSVLGEGTLAQGAAVLVAFQFVSIFLHEWAHALTVKAYKRKVRRAGFFLLYGLPGVFVDTTDIWPAGKRAQIAVTWAGPFSNLVLGGIPALWILLNPTSQHTALAYQFAFSQYSLVLLNLTPFIRLDGYYLLADWLGIANLNQRSSGFLRNGLPSKMRQAWQQGHVLPRLTREELILVIFGGLSALWLANLLGLAILTAPARIVNVLTSAVTGQLAGASPVTLGLTVLGMLFTLLLLIRAVGWVRQMIRQMARAFQTAPVWRMALVFGILALIAASIPDLLLLRDVAESTAQGYAAALSLAASLIALIFATRLVRELHGASLRAAAVGMQISGLLLVGIDVLACLNLLPIPSIASAEFIRIAAAASLLPALAASLLTFTTIVHLAQAPLKWGLLLSLLGGAALLIDMVVRIPGVVLFLSIAGRALIAAALILHVGMLYRPLVLRRVPPASADADPAVMLAGAVKSIVRELVQTVGEIAGKPAMLALAAQFNTHAAQTDLPFWLTMDGGLGDQTSGSLDERARQYASLLQALSDAISQRLGAAVARDAYSQAMIELPLVSRMLADRWIANPMSSGQAGLIEDDRARLRLAGRRVAETLMISCTRTYGWRLSDEIVGGFNRVAAAADWPMYLRGNGRLADELGGDLLGIAQIYADALQDLLGRIVRVAGVAFVQRGLLQVYDTLPWDVREVANPTLFARLTWARDLVTQAGDDPALEFLQTVPLFGSLTVEELTELVKQMSVRRVPAGHVVFEAGTYLDRLAVIRKGRAQAAEKQASGYRVVEHLSAGSLIGLRSISDRAALPHRYTAQTDVELWEIDPESVLSQLNALLQLHQEADPQTGVQSLLARIPLFAALDASRRSLVARRLQPITVPAGSVILQEGQASQGFYIIQAGDLDVLITAVDGTERHLSRLGAGEFFGEAALMTGAVVSATIRSASPAAMLRLAPDDFHELIAATLRSSLEQVQSRRAHQRAAVQHMVIVQEGVADAAAND